MIPLRGLGGGGGGGLGGELGGERECKVISQEMKKLNTPQAG